MNHSAANHHMEHKHQMGHMEHMTTCLHFMKSNFELRGSTAPYIVNACLNIPLAILGTASSVLVLMSIRRTASLHLPSKLLLLNLSLTDLGVGVIAQPLFMTFLLAKVKRDEATSCFAYASFGVIGAMLNCVSLMTMTAISIDRYISLYFYISYRAILTVKRVSVVLLTIWLFSGLYAFLRLWYPMSHSYLIIAICCTSFIVTTVAYTMVYGRLRHHFSNQIQVQVHGHVQQQETTTLNVAKFRRSASGMLWIYGVFVLCYLPYVVVKVVKQLVGHSASVQCLIEYSITIVCLNSFLNPIIYYFRLPAIRSGVQETLRKIFAQSSQPPTFESRPT